MKDKISSFRPIVFRQTFFPVIQRHVSRIPLLIWCNCLTAAILCTLSLYAKVEHKGEGIENLFSDPFYNTTPYLGWLTGISEILWCVIITVCVFTIALLPKIRRRPKKFLLASALLLTILFFDDRFRLTLILCGLFRGYENVKIVIYSLYGSLLISYGITFWHKIRNTPYLPLLMSFFLFALSSFADLAPISSKGAHAMLEDGTKLLGLINLTLYFWYVCRIEIERSRNY